MNLEEHIKCQICEKSFKTKSILIHIGRSQHCHQEYPNSELEKLRSAANMRKLSQLKEIKRKTYNSQKRSDENKRHYENKKTEIRTKQQMQTTSRVSWPTCGHSKKIIPPSF